MLHMTGGEGDISYAMNSRPQEKVISKAKRIVQETVIGLYSKTLPTCFTIADLGCSSGPNSLSAISQIIDAIVSMCQEVGRPSPEFQVILDDLPGNDFNTIFKSIPHFIQKLNRDKGNDFVSCFISGVSGSFFARLFPSQFLNFVHTSYSLHYLSQVPPGVSKTSPPNVYQAYLSQYQKDFMSFLSLRSKEIVPGGSMVITIMGRQSSDPASKECCWGLDVLAHSLAELVSEGRVEVEKFNSFNWPTYFSRIEELQPIIEEEGSFYIDLLDSFEVKVVSDCDLQNGNEMLTKGQYISNIFRAVIEVVVASKFGDDIIEDLFHRFADHMKKYLANGNEISTFNIIMSMTRK